MFDWLFGKSNFRFYEDSFARTRSIALDGIKRAILGRVESNDAFLLVAHFPDCFEEIQNALHSWKLSYEILDKVAAPENIVRHFSHPEHRILITLSSLLIHDQKVHPDLDFERKIGVVCAERHPFIQYDDALEQFCRSIPASVELGYFLSFEDAVVKALVNESSIKILDMFGMGENELITSNMITRRLKTVLKQNATKYTSDHDADSADQWIELNLPGKTEEEH